jgi:hypothetical protein
VKRRRGPRPRLEPRPQPDPWLTPGERHDLAAKAAELVMVRRGAPDAGAFSDVARHLVGELADPGWPELTIARLTGLAEELAGLASQFADLADATAGAGTVDAWLEHTGVMANGSAA